MNDEFKNPSSQTLVVSKVKEKKPKLYKVILLNDDYTPMEYVVKLLREVFRKTENDAINIMLMVHKKGSGVCGIFTKEIAETKDGEITNLTFGAKSSSIITEAINKACSDFDKHGIFAGIVKENEDA